MPKSILEMSREELAALTVQDNTELASRMAPVRNRGFGTVSAVPTKPSFKLFSAQGDEFSLSSDGEVCMFSASAPHLVAVRSYPENAEAFLKLAARFLGFEVVKTQV